MCFRLRTLTIVVGLMPPVLAWVWIRRPPLGELVGCAAMAAICSLAYWSLGLSAKDHANLVARAKRHAASKDESPPDHLN